MTFPLPNDRGRFGEFGGRYVPETLIPALDELTEAYDQAVNDPEFGASLSTTSKRSWAAPAGSTTPRT